MGNDFWWFLKYTMKPSEIRRIPPMPEVHPEYVEELVKAFKERYAARKDS